MLYIIDGYNLFFHYEEEPNPFEETRDDFLSHLVALLETLRISATIIFDGNPGHSTHKPIRKKLCGVEILFSPDGLDADTYILEFLTIQKNPQLTTVVTSDRELQRRAKSFDAKILSLSEFFSLLNRKQSRVHQKKTSEKPRACDELSHQRWLEIFESRLEKADNDEEYL